MYIALVTVYIIICFFLILVVLLQQGKGADIAGAFGGGGSQTAFGARGATTLLHKLTTGAFVGFVLISMILSILEARPRSSVIQKLPAGTAAAPKAAPAPPGQPVPPARPAAAPAAQPTGSAPAVPAGTAPATAPTSGASTSGAPASASPAKP